MIQVDIIARNAETGGESAIQLDLKRCRAAGGSVGRQELRKLFGWGELKENFPSGQLLSVYIGADHAEFCLLTDKVRIEINGISLIYNVNHALPIKPDDHREYALELQGKSQTFHCVLRVKHVVDP